MNRLLKIVCLAVYALALVGLFTELPFGSTTVIRYLALALLGAHALELLLFFRHVKRYEGPLIVSVALTLLFGFLHWKPLASASNPPAARAASQR